MTQKILLYEDSPMMAGLVTAACEHHGYSVYHTPFAENAIRAIQNPSEQFVKYILDNNAFWDEYNTREFGKYAFEIAQHIPHFDYQNVCVFSSDDLRSAVTSRGMHFVWKDVEELEPFLKK